jgi:hypothetical protein
MTFIRSSARGPRKFFEWNRSDVSQFETPATWSAFASSATLSVANFIERGLALNPAVVGSGGTAVFLAKDPIPFPDNRKDLRFEMEVFSCTGTAGYVGLCFLADDSILGNFHGLAHLPFNDANGDDSFMVQADTRLTGTAASGGVGQSGLAIIEVRGQKSGSGGPRITSAVTNQGILTTPNRHRRTGSAVEGALAYDSGASVPAASWNTLAANRWGIAIMGGGVSSAPDAYIGNLKAYLL